MWRGNALLGRQLCVLGFGLALHLESSFAWAGAGISQRCGCQPVLPARPPCRLVLIVGFGPAVSREGIRPWPRKEPSCPARSEVPRVSGIFHSSFQPNVDSEEIKKNPLRLRKPGAVLGPPAGITRWPQPRLFGKSPESGKTVFDWCWPSLGQCFPAACPPGSGATSRGSCRCQRQLCRCRSPCRGRRHSRFPTHSVHDVLHIKLPVPRSRYLLGLVASGLLSHRPSPRSLRLPLPE